MANRWLLTSVAAIALACARPPQPHAVPETPQLQGAWNLEVYEDGNVVLTANLNADDDSALTGRYGISGRQAVDACLPQEGQFFGVWTADTLTVWLNPMVSHCGLRLRASSGPDVIAGRWCTESFAGPICGEEEAAWTGEFLLSR